MKVHPVEKNIPSPVPHREGGKYKFSELNIGDSRFIETENRNQVSNAMYMFSKRNGVKLVSRAEGNGVRVWRIS